MKDEDTAFYEQFTAREQIPRRLSRASISGGVPITNWTDLGSNVYKAIVPSTILVNQLFVDNQRFSRSRLPTDPSLYLQYD
ncbi:unnamed protein product, partial [Rotaria magnacalcarata]